MTPLTLGDLYRAVDRLVPGLSYVIRVEAWNHSHHVPRAPQVEWTIMVLPAGESGCDRYEGASPEAALDRLRAAVAPPEPTPLDAVAVGDLGAT